jgi:hypothetical protein
MQAFEFFNFEADDSAGLVGVIHRTGAVTIGAKQGSAKGYASPTGEAGAGFRARKSPWGIPRGLERQDLIRGN